MSRTSRRAPHQPAAVAGTVPAPRSPLDSTPGGPVPAPSQHVLSMSVEQLAALAEQLGVAPMTLLGEPRIRLFHELSLISGLSPTAREFVAWLGTLDPESRAAVAELVRAPPRRP